jgi:hypothetical protein
MDGEADDVVQEVWPRLSRPDTSDVEKLIDGGGQVA